MPLKCKQRYYIKNLNANTQSKYIRCKKRQHIIKIVIKLFRKPKTGTRTITASFNATALKISAFKHM